MLLTLRGTPFLYYGDEIALPDAALDPAKALDPVPHRTGDPSRNRDECRTPMQWDGEPGAGFTNGAEPWLPFADDRSVAAQREDPGSTLHLVRDLIALRRERADLREGGYETVDGPAWVYRRGEGTVVALNLSDSPVTVDVHGHGPGRAPTARASRSTAAWRRGRAWSSMAELAWWQRGAIYQIYPRSFADSNGDGDRRPARDRLAARPPAELAVEAIWLSPFFRSPMADFGYDVSDYRDVDPIFGTLEDFDHLVAAVPRPRHPRGDRLGPEPHLGPAPVVPGLAQLARRPQARLVRVARRARTTGPRSSRPSGRRGRSTRPTGQWYLHSFMREQPDLNWDNPEVEAAMHDVIRFWMDRGVDGLRLDAIHKIAKDPLLRDHAGAPRRHDEDWETIHERLRGIRRVVDEYDDRMVVGEVALQDLHRIVGYLESGDQLHLAHNFVFVDLPWDAEAFGTSIDDFEALADRTAWPAWFLENHDKPRLASRFGAGPARAAAVMLYALRGTPFVYQGQELGLPDTEIPPDRVVDVDGRDPERTPIPWEPGPGAGFTDGEPWLPVDDALQRPRAGRRPALGAVAVPPRSRRCGASCRSSRAAAQRTVEAGPDVLAWLRDERILVAVNFAGEPRPLERARDAAAVERPGRDRRAARAARGRHREAR